MLQARGGSLIVIDDAEVPDDLVRDMTGILTCFCARLYGRRSAANRPKRALEAASGWGSAGNPAPARRDGCPLPS